MPLRIDLSGDKELIKILEQLPKKVKKPLLVKAFRKAAKPLIAEMKSRAPVGSKKAFLTSHNDFKKGARSTKLVKHKKGELKRSIGVIIGKGPIAAVYVGTRYGGAKANDGWYAHFVEFGTVKQKAQPFIRPAWQRMKGRVQDSISYTIMGEIRKLIVKHAKAI